MAGLISGGGPSFSPGIEQQNRRGPCCSSDANNDDPISRSKHKIFFSHSGVQRKFVDHLCEALKEYSYYPFFDKCLESLPKDKKFPDLILKAIQQCQLFVVVISEEYFMSKWPMIELNAFVKAKKEMQSSINPRILPLFYGLSLSELKDDKRRQRWFEKWETFARDDSKGLIKVDDWKYALDELTKFNGLSYVQGLKQVVEYENEIVSHICKLVAPNIKLKDLHIQGNTHEMKHMVPAISPLSLLKEVVIEFAKLSDSILLIFPTSDLDPVKIEDKDLQSLQPKRHLSISIIDFYIKYLEKDVLIKDKDRFFFFNCSFFISTFGNKTTSIDIDYEQARQWIQGVNLFEKDYIFIPVYKNKHWSLIIIYHLSSLTRSPTDVHYRSPCIFHLFSVEGNDDDLEGDIRSFIFKSWTEIHQNSDILQAFFRMKYVEAKVPTGDNGYDSGIYLLYYIDLLIIESASPDFNFGTEQGKLHFPHWDTSELLAKRKNIQNLIFKLSGMTQLQGTLRLHSSDIFSWLQRIGAIEGGIDDVKSNDLTMVNGEELQSENGSHQIQAVTMLNDHQTFDVEETLTLLGEETRLLQIEDIRRQCHVEESSLQANNDTPILHKKSENRRSRKSNWSTAETSVLLRCVVGFDEFPQGNNATRWDFIVGEVNRVCGTTHTRMQCQYRFDTLSKAFKQADEFCKTNAKEFFEITEKERREMKLATTLTREWYTLMAQHYDYKVNYKMCGKPPFDCATRSTTKIQIEATTDILSSPRIDTHTLLSNSSGEFQSEILLEPPATSSNNHHNGTPIPKSLLTTSPPRRLVQRKKSRSNEDEMKGIYRRAIKDIDGGLLRFKYEPRFKPPRDINPLGGFETYNMLSLGSYNTLQEAKDVRQIAAHYYGQSDAWMDLGDGTHFLIPDCGSIELQSLCGNDKRIWVQHKVKEVFATFQMEKARLNILKTEKQLSLANPNPETKEPIHGHMIFSNDILDAGSMVVMQDEPRICFEDDSVHRPRLSEGMRNDPILEPKHKIFLSYSGAQKEFVEHLCKALEDRLYYPFFDRHPESLPKGEQFLELVVQAAKQCEMLIVVVSNEYFMSKWAMIELSAFVKAHKLRQESKSSTNGPKILPLFYGLSVGDLDDERLQNKWFNTWATLAKADPKSQIIVSDWKYALDVLRSFNGLPYDRNFKEIVAYEEKIVSYVCKSISPDIRWDDSHVQGKSNILKFIGEKIEGIGVSRRYKVKVVGLYGVGGIGKTTACKILCNELSSKYEGRVCHIEFPIVPSSDSTEYFQKVLWNLTNKSMDCIQYLDGGECKDILRKSLSKYRTFLVLDNISDNHQSIQLAKMLLEVPLHTNSLVVVTTCSRFVLDLLGINEDACLEMPDLEEGDAVKLFLDHTVGSKEFFEDEEKHDIMTCVRRCYFSKGDGQGHHYHPLALKALGLQLSCYGENPSIWVKNLLHVRDLNFLPGRNHVFDICEQ